MRQLHELGLELFDYPMDIRLEEGEEYVDPTIPEGELGWFYTSVEADYDLPEDITYEILEECYIPEEGEFISQPIAGTGGSGIVDVERAAFEMVGYEVESQAPQTRANVKPRGTIRVWDNSKEPAGYVPVKGVKIRCHVLVKWSTTYTREDGSYTMESNFAIGPHYAIVYDNNKRFTIWDNWGPFAAANHNMGWHSQKGHDEDLDDKRGSWAWAVVNNATYEYYQMCEQTGIAKPPRDLKIMMCPSDFSGFGSCAIMSNRMNLGSGSGSIQNKIKKLADDKRYGDQCDLLAWLAGIAVDGFGTDLLIDYKDDSYGQIYNTMNHELSHASHHNQVGNSYWEKYIHYILDSLLAQNSVGTYGDGTGENAGICEVGEMWGHMMGDISMSEKYNRNRLNFAYIDTSQPFPYNFSGAGGDDERVTDDWIHPDPLWALITQGVLTKKQIFDCLTPDARSRQTLVNKLALTYPSDTAHPNREGLIWLAFIANDIPRLTGVNRTMIGTLQTYRVPNLAGVTFAGWTVTGTGVTSEDYSVTGGVSGQTLNIRFLKPKQFTLRANFTLPGGAVHSVTQKVEATIPDLSITGTEIPILNHSASYSIAPATLPTGVTFAGWKVSPGTNGVEWTRVGSTTAQSIALTFRKQGAYTLTANFNFPGGLVYPITKQVSTLHIAGPDEPQRTVMATYSAPVAQAQAAGITFNGWAVSTGPGACIIHGGTNGVNLSVTFMAAIPHTLSAKFTRPDGTTFAVDKVIDLNSYPQKPVIEQDMTYTGTPKVLIKNIQGGATYDWQFSGSYLVAARGDNYILVIRDPASGSSGPGIGARVKGRTKLNGRWSDWSNEITIVAVRPYSMVLSSDDLTLDDVEATELGETSTESQLF